MNGLTALLLPLALIAVLAVSRGGGPRAESVDTIEGDGSAGRAAFDLWAELDAAEGSANR